MNSYPYEDRPQKLAQYIIDNNCTVRACARYFGISKSTVHKDVSERLAQINKSLYTSVKQILDKNKSERHIRGGEATKEKYKYIKKFKSRGK